METRLLFWNLNKRPLASLVAGAIAEHQIDVAIFAECNIERDELLDAIRQESGKPFCQPFCPTDKLRVVTRFAEENLQATFDDPTERLTIRRLRLGTSPEILLAAVHFQSKVNWKDEDQLAEVSNLARSISSIEAQRGHQRTVLVGDLNMNPFDAGMVAASGLHGVMTRAIAEKRTRTVAGNDYHFFYNPMWGCFGDRTVGPAGTHFYQSSAHTAYFWNMYDQVLVRPDLMKALKDVRILQMVGGIDLLGRSGRPDRKAGSDHLPIVCQLDFEAKEN